MKNHRITELLNHRIPYSVILLFCYSVIASAAETAALPEDWDVDLAAQPPQVFALQRPRGETYELKAVLKRHGKPFEPAITNACIYWQTNGMENLYWSAPASVSNNVLRATWLPSMDPGATTVRGYIGDPGHIYAAAFQFRFIASPGPLPNALPLPTPVIDFAKVRVLNPPWSGGGGGGVDTNAVRDIIHEQLATNGIRSVDGAARPLPKYLHLLDFDDTYPADAEWYYRQPQPYGLCSSVRDCGFLYRNYDWKFDDAAEFVVRMGGTRSVASGVRFASIGVANCGTNLTESFVTSGKPSRYYKCLPGRVVDGINEHGVACNINVVDGDPQTSGWHNDTGDLHPLAAVRWALDNATNAQHAAEYLAARIAFPAGWAQNFHYMVCDATSTYIVENGEAHAVTNGVPVMTNFRLYPTRDTSGAGQERYDLLAGGEPITNAWYTRAYSPTANWRSEFKSIEEQNAATNGWARLGTMEARRATGLFWQSVHTSVYDITNRVLRVAVQETDDWYVFQVPSSGAKVDAYTKAETDAKLAGKANKNGDINEVFSAEAVEVDSFLLVNGLQISNIDGDIEVAADSIRTPSDSLKEKANRPSSPYTFGNLASLDENGDLADSGIAAEDVAKKDDLSAKMDNNDSMVTVGTGWGLEFDGITFLRYNNMGDFAFNGKLEGAAEDQVTSAISDAVADLAPKSMISATDPTFSNEVATVAKTVQPTTVRAYDSVRRCWWVLEIVNGVPTWTVED